MPRRWWALVAVALATFMTYLDNNVTNVAIPTIQRDLHLSIAGLEWVVSSYILVFAGLLLVGGRLADAFGRRLLFLAGLGGFTLASLAAGLAGSGGVLIGARVVQGLGAALMVPTTLAIIVATFTDARERARAVGVWTAISAMALAIGPLIGGFISQHLHWGWIFLINVPVGAATFALGLATIGESRDTSAGRRLDLPGLAASAAALFALTLALIEGHDWGWTSAGVLAAFAVAGVAGLAFLAIESRAANPMVPVSLFRSRAFSGGTGTMMVWAFAIFGIYFFTSLYLQGVLGFSPTRAGLAFLPMALVMAVFAGLSGPVAARIGTHRSVALGLALNGLGLYLFWRLGAGASFGSLMPGFTLFGAGSGLMTVPLTNAVLGAMPPERSGIASALLNNSREVAGLLGITMIGAVLRSREGGLLAHGATPTRAFLAGYHAGLIVTIAMMGAGVLIGYLAFRRTSRPIPAGGLARAAGPVPAAGLPAAGLPAAGLPAAVPAPAAAGTAPGRESPAPHV